MSEDFVPEVTAAPDVEETTKALDEETAASAAETVDLNALSLSELSEMFDRLSQSEDRMKRYKEAEAIKSAFYKKLSKEKAEAGLGAAVDEPSSREDVVDEVVVPADGNLVADNPFEAMEAAFKGVYANYKKERAEYNRQQDALREENLVLKQAVIDDLKALVEKQEDVNSTFPAFRELQNRWKSIGPVPASKFRDLNDNYQYNVEKFYDMVKINRDLRDLDFKKNLEAKQKFCEFAEKLSENDNVVEAFRELQKLHEQWKEFGPVAKEFRDSIWERFKAATSVINKKYQAYFEDQKEKQQVEFCYEGPALNIQSDFSVTCRENTVIQGSVNAGDGVNCGQVCGNVSAGDSVNCGEVYGSVSAGDGVNCGDVRGSVTAGDNVRCGSVGGNVRASDGVSCGDVQGGVRAGDSVRCTAVYGSASGSDGVHICK